MAFGLSLKNQIVINIEEISLMTKSEATECSNGPPEAYIRATIKTMRGKDMERCTGQMALCIRENGIMVSNMAMEQ